MVGDIIHGLSVSDKISFTYRFRTEVCYETFHAVVYIFVLHILYRMRERRGAANRFYLAVGFQEFEVFPMLWDECNPCQIYVMALK